MRFSQEQSGIPRSKPAAGESFDPSSKRRSGFQSLIPQSFYQGSMRGNAWMIKMFLLSSGIAALLAILLEALFDFALVNLFGISIRQSLHLVLDGIFLAITLPIILWILLSSPLGGDLAATGQLDRLSKTLTETTTFREVATQVVWFAHRLFPRSWVTLSINDHLNEKSIPLLLCSPQGVVTFDPDPAVVALHTTQSAFSLPLEAGEQSIASLTLQHTDQRTIPLRPLQVLQRALPVVALAMLHALRYEEALQNSTATETERRRIAQDLHDTLAQNVGYLRLKLDHLSVSGTTLSDSDLEEEIVRLTQVANQTYEQVRTMLDELNPHAQEDLYTSLNSQARLVGQRARFQYHLSQSGKPFALATETQRHIEMIHQEALHNIEKHAQATHVKTKLIWLKEGIILKISDDGIGFDFDAEVKQGHYGLSIMQQRTKAIGGEIKMTRPEDHSGVEVTLWVPRSVSIQ